MDYERFMRRGEPGLCAEESLGYAQSTIPTMVYPGISTMVLPPSSRVYPATPPSAACPLYRYQATTLRSDKALGSKRGFSLGVGSYSFSGPQECDGWWELCAQILPALG